jgi:hypothetical protein
MTVNNPATYIKALIAFGVTLVGAFLVALDGDSTIGAGDWIAIAIAALGSGGLTWLVTKSTAAKAIVGALSAALGSLSLAVVDGSFVTTQEWLTAALAGLVSLGAVYQIPNSDDPPPTP